MKNFIISSFFAMGAIGLSACGDDSSSSPSDDTSSSSAEELILSSVSETSPLDAESNIIVKFDPNEGGTLRFSGSIRTDSENFTTEGWEGDEEVFYAIDSLSFDVGRKESDGTTTKFGNLPVKLKEGAKFGKENLVIASTLDQIKIDASSIPDGNYVLYVTVYMSGEDPETKDFKYTGRIEAEFSVVWPKEESSSSEAEVCTEITASEQITLSNKVASNIDYFNFDGGVEPQVTLKIEDRATYLVAAAGVTLYEMDEYDAKALLAPPDPPICLEKFTVLEKTKASEMEMIGANWYMVVTPGGKYPLNAKKSMYQDNTKADFDFVYYK